MIPLSVSPFFSPMSLTLSDFHYIYHLGDYRNTRSLKYISYYFQIWWVNGYDSHRGKSSSQ